MHKEKLVTEIIEKIKRAEETGNYDFIWQDSLKRRLAWYEKNKDKLELDGSEVKKAYTILLLNYMGLDSKEVPVVYEDERKIVWKSFSWCPVLEACKRANFDTREVCKKGWEKSVQEFVKKINPKIKFSRNYEKIRPHAEYCEETFELVE